MQWEYDVKILTGESELTKLVHEINVSGADGWEVVAVTQQSNIYTVVMKRQKR